MIYGNTEGIKNSLLDRLEEIYSFVIPKDSLFNFEMFKIMNEVTLLLNREISVAINRKGKVTAVSVGDSGTVELPEVDVLERKLNGIRIVHTHPNGNSKLSALDISALTKLKLDSMVAVAVNEDIERVRINIGFCGVFENRIICEEGKNFTLDEGINFNPISKIEEINEALGELVIHEDTTERAILVGIESHESLDELEELAKACNLEVIEKVLQKRQKIDAAFFIGKGKVGEIDYLRQALKADVVIFDDRQELEYWIRESKIDYIILGDHYINKKVIGEEFVKGVIYFKTDFRSTTNIIEKQTNLNMIMYSS